jgi:hypothetical protein
MSTVGHMLLLLLITLLLHMMHSPSPATNTECMQQQLQNGVDAIFLPFFADVRS